MFFLLSMKSFCYYGMNHKYKHQLILHLFKLGAMYTNTREVINWSPVTYPSLMKSVLEGCDGPIPRSKATTPYKRGKEHLPNNLKDTP